LIVLFWRRATIALTLSLLVGFSRLLFFLLLGFPLLSNFFEFFWRTLRSVRLHCDMCVQMVECAVGLFATIPTTLVHALDFFVSPPWALMLLCTWNRNK
jgi:hypothetical protein